MVHRAWLQAEMQKRGLPPTQALAAALREMGSAPT